MMNKINYMNLDSEAVSDSTYVQGRGLPVTYQNTQLQDIEKNEKEDKKINYIEPVSTRVKQQEIKDPVKKGYGYAAGAGELRDLGGIPSDDNRTPEQRNKDYLHPVLGAKDRWKESMRNETNPVVGINKTIVPAIEVAAVAHSLPYFGMNALRGAGIPITQNVTTRYLAKNASAAQHFTNASTMSDLSRLIQNPDNENKSQLLWNFLPGKDLTKMWTNLKYLTQGGMTINDLKNDYKERKIK